MCIRDRELPRPETPIELSKESTADTLAHSGNPEWGRNRQFGLIKLTDSYFGGALDMFREEIQKVAERQLRKLPLAHVQERAQVIISLTDPELRESLRDTLTRDCTFGCKYKKKDGYYEREYSHHYMISDLPQIAAFDDFNKSKSRKLFMNITQLREQIAQLKQVVHTLKQTEHGYFEELEKKVDQFLDGDFLKDLDGFKTQIADDYTSRYKKQVIAKLTYREQDYALLFPDVVYRQKELEGLVKNAPGTQYYVQEDRKKYMQKLAEALNKEGDVKIEDPKMLEDFERLQAYIKDLIPPPLRENNWKSMSLISPNAEEDSESLGEKILKSATKNKGEFSALADVLESLALVYDMSELYAAIPDDRKPSTPIWEPQKEGVELVHVTQPYAVLRMVMADGKPLSDFTENDQWTDPYSHRKHTWPPTDEEYLQQYYEEHRQNLKVAFANVTPIDISINPRKPVALVLGMNGSGKTFAMEALVQALGLSHRSGLQFFTDEQRSAYTPTVRAAINASRHSERVSSFQGEVDLMVDIINDILDHKEGSAVWAIDEVGKGTDSRDALALLFGMIEWARRNNVYFTVSTHYGKQFMELAEILGVADAIQIYTPDGTTHAILKTDTVTASQGVEVMGKMGARNSISPELLNGLTENAKKVRAIHDTREITQLTPIETPRTEGPIQFAHEEDLIDIGLSPSYSFESDGSFSFSMLPNEQWGNIKTLFGEELNTYYGADTPLDKIAQSVRLRWSKQFLDRFADQKLNPTQLQERKGFIHDMVDSAQKEYAVFTSSSEQLFAAAVGTEALIRPIVSGQIRKSVDEFFAKPDAFPELSISSQVESDLYKVFQTFSSPQYLADYQKAVLQCTSFLTSQETSPYLKNLGQTIALLAELPKTLEQSNIPVAELTKRYSTAVSKYLITNIRSAIIPSSSMSSDAFKQLLPQMNQLFLGTFQTSNEFYEYLITSAQNGDLTNLVKLHDWVNTQQIRSGYPPDPCSLLKEKLIFLDEIKTNLTQRLRYRRGALQIAYSIVSNDEARAEEIATQAYDAFISGDATLLDKLLSIPGSDPYTGFDDMKTIQQLDKIHQALAVQKWQNWNDFLSLHQFDEAPNYYTLLGIDPKTPSEEMKAKLDAIRASKSIPDQTIDDASKILLADTRPQYNLLLAKRALDEIQFFYTIAGAIQRDHMCIPERTTDGSFQVTKGINLGLQRYKKGMREGDYIPQSLTIGADTNTVIIGGMNGGGKSQALITMADIVTWDHFIGYVPAKKAKLPQCDFIVSAINAGESIVGMSSFQNEITRYLKVLDRYIEAGCPQNGMVFLDEPLAGTSSEDQTGILVSIIDFFQSRGVKVILTNHNHALYDALRRTTGSSGKPIKFLPVAFGSEGKSKFQLTYYKPHETNKIRSRGIDVAEERGLDPSIIAVARQVRQLIDKIDEIKSSSQS